jgi:hypothetical protein
MYSISTPLALVLLHQFKIVLKLLKNTLTIDAQKWTKVRHDRNTAVRRRQSSHDALRLLRFHASSTVPFVQGEFHAC